MLTIIRTLLENLVLRSMCSNNVLIIVDIINCTLVGKTLNQIHNTTFCKKLVLWHSNGVARIILGCGDVDKRKIKGAVGVAIACLSSVAAGNVGVTLLPCREGFHESVFKLQENISHHQQDFCNSGYASVEHHERVLRMLNFGRLNVSSMPVKWYTMPKKFCITG
ncbi:hypothetical protein D0Y65_041331 [Glycine soja]|uniref:Uncharacterized protein n=1 Tax=Glycine soja TaxID=3848 RepID=A0A445GVE7_GLYSO|nr:hypothetical protein D0Y65_041331 [Glycine soja]